MLSCTYLKIQKYLAETTKAIKKKKLDDFQVKI